MPREAKRCNGYEIFVAAVNENQKSGMNRDEAIKKAILDCIDKNILREYLKQKGAEVMNMMLGEWNMEGAKAVWKEEGILIGKQEGILIGEREGILIGEQRGILIGEQRGMRHGMQQGMREERKEIARNMLAKGMDVETIASITGLFIDDVLRLQGE